MRCCRLSIVGTSLSYYFSDFKNFIAHIIIRYTDSIYPQINHHDISIILEAELNFLRSRNHRLGSLQTRIESQQLNDILLQQFHLYNIYIIDVSKHLF
jgi:hypothetical protein